MQLGLFFGLGGLSNGCKMMIQGFQKGGSGLLSAVYLVIIKYEGPSEVLPELLNCLGPIAGYADAVRVLSPYYLYCTPEVGA